MTNMMYDTLSSVRRLRERGIPQEQAEAFADELRIANQFDIGYLSTKEELSAFKADMKTEFTEVKAEFALVRSEMREQEARLQAQMKDLLIKLGGMIFALGGLLVAIKYFG